MLLGNIVTQFEDKWQKMLQTNIIGVLNGIKIILADMTSRNGGTSINISSIAGFKAFIDHATYGASKFGIH